MHGLSSRNSTVGLTHRPCDRRPASKRLIWIRIVAREESSNRIVVARRWPDDPALTGATAKVDGTNSNPLTRRAWRCASAGAAPANDAATATNTPDLRHGLLGN